MQAIVTEMFLLFYQHLFLCIPLSGSPVTMPALLLWVQIMTHVDTTRLFPLPGSGVYDPTMSE